MPLSLTFSISLNEAVKNHTGGWLIEDDIED